MMLLVLLLLLKFLLIVVADIMATADVADLVGKFRLWLPVAETIGSDTESVRILLRWC